LWEGNWFAWRINVHDGQTDVYCDQYCELHDSYIHGVWANGSGHLGAFHDTGTGGDTPRLLDHNTFLCNIVGGTLYSGGGCAGDMNLIPDPGQRIVHYTVTNNLFMATPDAYYCAYSGAAGRSGDPTTFGTNDVWTNNTFQKGPAGLCGNAGAVKDWQQNTGNQWCNNRWNDGTLISKTNETC
jgi:hypothetical protein